MDPLTNSRDDAQFVTLGIEQEVFAVPVEAVIEILDMRPIFRIPDAPAYVAGLVDVRGRGVPAIDLRTKLGLPSAAPTETTRILVLEVAVNNRQLVLGLIADRVFEVATLNTQQIAPPPDIGVTWRSEYIRGVGHRGDGFVIIFDLARLFSSEEVALIRQNAVEALGASIAQQPETQTPALA